MQMVLEYKYFISKNAEFFVRVIAVNVKGRSIAIPSNPLSALTAKISLGLPSDMIISFLNLIFRTFAISTPY